MAGDEGIEPSNNDAKDRRLTAWLIPYIRFAYVSSGCALTLLREIDNVLFKSSNARVLGGAQFLRSSEFGAEFFGVFRFVA